MKRDFFMSNNLLKTTDDGSHTLYVPEIDECYHSTHGAIQESEHIFIKNGFQVISKNEISILEIGFGTGLNAFLTTIEAEKTGKKVNYTALEYYPILKEIALTLNYPEKITYGNKDLFTKIHSATWNTWEEITPFFKLKKIETDFTQYNFKDKFDVIYFDAFSPEKQPEMWTYELFKKIYLCTENSGVFITYSCKGSVKRALKAAGFTVKKIPGPVGKREILQAIK